MRRMQCIADSSVQNRGERDATRGANRRRRPGSVTDWRSGAPLKKMRHAVALPIPTPGQGPQAKAGPFHLQVPRCTPSSLEGETSISSTAADTAQPAKPTNSQIIQPRHVARPWQRGPGVADVTSPPPRDDGLGLCLPPRPSRQENIRRRMCAHRPHHPGQGRINRANGGADRTRTTTGGSARIAMTATAAALSAP